MRYWKKILQWVGFEHRSTRMKFLLTRIVHPNVRFAWRHLPSDSSSSELPRKIPSVKPLFFIITNIFFLYSTLVFFLQSCAQCFWQCYVSDKSTPTLPTRFLFPKNCLILSNSDENLFFFLSLKTKKRINFVRDFTWKMKRVSFWVFWKNSKSEIKLFLDLKKKYKCK